MQRSLSFPLPLTLILCAGLAAPALAQEITTFQNGEVANADQVNGNFNVLKTSVQAAQAAADSANAALLPFTSALKFRSLGSAPDLISFLEYAASNDVGFVASAYGEDKEAFFLGRSAGGTEASPTATLSNTVLSSLNGVGHTGTGFTDSTPVYINFLANEVFSPTAHGTRMEFATTASGSTSEAIRMVVDDQGVRSTNAVMVGNDNRNVLYRGNTARFGSAANWSPASGPGVFLEHGEAESGGFFANGNTAVIWSPGDNNLLNIYDEDSLGGPNLAPRAFLTNVGTWFAAGYQTISDQRFKTNIRPIESALDKVMQISGFTYDLRADELHAGEIAAGKSYDAAALRNKIGFVAQDLQRTIPELVSHSADLNCLTVNYDGMIPVLVEAIKTQQQQIEALRAEVQQLRAAGK